MCKGDVSIISNEYDELRDGLLPELISLSRENLRNDIRKKSVKKSIEMSRERILKSKEV